MKRMHFDVGDGKVACRFSTAPANFSHTTVREEVTCLCCAAYAKGFRSVGDFCATTVRSHRDPMQPYIDFLDNPLVKLLKRAYDELPDPEFVPDEEKAVRIRALQEEILQAVSPIDFTAPSAETLEWARNAQRTGAEHG